MSISKSYIMLITLLLSFIAIIFFVPNSAYSISNSILSDSPDNSHSLATVNINADGFEALYSSNDKNKILTGTIEFIDENNHICFSQPCGISLSGNASLNMVMHKSIKIDFGNEYGGNKSINYDMFNTGQTDYRSFILRAGADAEYRVFNEVIWQNLAMEMNSVLYTQHSRYCVAYINDSYYGLFIIKDNIGARSFSIWKNVPKSTVEAYSISKNSNQDYNKIFLSYIKSHDLSVNENYLYACSMVDIDNMIDYLIIEGVSGNSDLYNNVRVFRSSSAENKWEYALFDLDAAMPYGNYGSAWNNLFSGYYNNENCLGALLNAFMTNSEFRAKFIERYAEVSHDILGNEKIIHEIELNESAISNEIDASFERWYHDGNLWRRNIECWKNDIISLDYENLCIRNFHSRFHLSDEELSLFTFYDG